MTRWYAMDPVDESFFKTAPHVYRYTYAHAYSHAYPHRHTHGHTCPHH